jgi:hypothetical protein
MDRIRATLLALGGGALGALAYQYFGRPRVRRWGATDDEAARSLPGDGLVDDPDQVTTRGITIDAAPSDVWPWLVQMGQDRGGFYSYDWLERLVGFGIENADRIHDEWQDRDVGDLVRLAPGSDMVVAELETERALVLVQEVPLRDRGIDADLRWTWAFVLAPTAGGDQTRLLVRTRVGWQPDDLLGHVIGPPIELVHLLMERGMLRGIRERAERTALRQSTPTLGRE